MDGLLWMLRYSIQNIDAKNDSEYDENSKKMKVLRE
jgi:hypothetical protein